MSILTRKVNKNTQLTWNGKTVYLHRDRQATLPVGEARGVRTATDLMKEIQDYFRK